MPDEARSRWDQVVKKARCPADPVSDEADKKRREREKKRRQREREAESKWGDAEKTRLDSQSPATRDPQPPPSQSDDSQLSDAPSIDG